ncbi:hypothetical protein [Microlunatus ginsengisoli]|uniref:Uncharacterized protein n=1 Tax=Microlunatus ginsengisoli TaxID=363863 RepID=A0ABP7ABN1_9ACTN
MPTRRRLAGLTVVSLLLGLLLSVAAVTAQAATTTDPNSCPIPKVPVDSVTVTCPGGSPSTAPSSSPSPSPTAGSPGESGDQKSASGAGDGSGGVRFGQDEQPTGWAGPIAKDLGQGTQGLSSDLADRVKDDGLLPKFEFTQAYLSLYAIMFGLGVVIAVMATMLASVKVAAAKGVDSRIMAQQAMIRVLAFSVIGGLAPLLLALLGSVAGTLGNGFFDLAADQMAAQLSWLSGALAVGTLAGLVVPGGSAVMVGLFLFLLASLAGIFLELMISHYLIFLLGLLIPILYAASINPDWRGGVQKVSGALLGAFLAPAALFLVWVVTFSAVTPWSSDDGFISKVGILIVGLLLSLAAPIAIGMLLSYVAPVFAGGHGYDTTAFKTATDRVRRRDHRDQPTSPRGSRSKRASSASDNDPSQPVESPTASGAAARTTTRAATGEAGASAGASGAGAGGAGAGGAAGAAGPVAAAALAWAHLVDKVRRTAESARDKVTGGAQRAGTANQGDADPAGQTPTSRTDGGRGAEPSSSEPVEAPTRPSPADDGTSSTPGPRPRGPETQREGGRR